MLISKKNRREVYKYLFKGTSRHVDVVCKKKSGATCTKFWLFDDLSSIKAAFSAEGVLQAEKDFNLASHPEIEGIPNLQVCPGKV